MEKVYVVTINEVSEFEQFDHDPIVYDNREAARALLKKAKEDAIADYCDEEDNGMAIDADLEDYFALYSCDEGWSHTHYEVQVTECEIQK